MAEEGSDSGVEFSWGGGANISGGELNFKRMFPLPLPGGKILLKDSSRGGTIPLKNLPPGGHIVL